LATFFSKESGPRISAETVIKKTLDPEAPGTGAGDLIQAAPAGFRRMTKQKPRFRGAFGVRTAHATGSPSVP